MNTTTFDASESSRPLGCGLDEPSGIEFTILMPCLNEAETTGICVKSARFLARAGISGEVLIADNGSTDGSQAIASDNGANVVAVRNRGYGAALLGGIEAAHGKYVIMGDADDSYDFTNLDTFVVKLREWPALKAVSSPGYAATSPLYWQSSAQRDRPIVFQD